MSLTRASVNEVVIMANKSLITIWVRSRILACYWSGVSKFQSSFVARSVERLIVIRKVCILRS